MYCTGNKGLNAFALYVPLDVLYYYCFSQNLLLAQVFCNSTQNQFYRQDKKKKK